jgi:hypothetical protein
LSIFEILHIVVQDIFGLFELYARSVEMNDNVVRMATDMLRNLNLPAKLIQRPQGDCFNLIFRYAPSFPTSNITPHVALIWNFE